MPLPAALAENPTRKIPFPVGLGQSAAREVPPPAALAENPTRQIPFRVRLEGSTVREMPVPAAPKVHQDRDEGRSPALVSIN
jgi:hypothetical protein